MICVLSVVSSYRLYLSRDMRFPTIWYVRPAKTQISLRIAQSDQSICLSHEYYMTVKLLIEQHLEFPSLLKRRLHRLVWIYSCQNATLLEITCRGSIMGMQCLVYGGKRRGWWKSDNFCNCDKSKEDTLWQCESKSNLNPFKMRKSQQKSSAFLVFWNF